MAVPANPIPNRGSNGMVVFCGTSALTGILLLYESAKLLSSLNVNWNVNVSFSRLKMAFGTKMPESDGAFAESGAVVSEIGEPDMENDIDPVPKSAV